MYPALMAAALATRHLLSRRAECEEYKHVLKQYKYVSPTQSLAERLFLDRWWDYVATFYPRWLAPNAITLVGSAFMALATAVLVRESVRVESDAPAAVYGLLYPLCLFV